MCGMGAADGLEVRPNAFSGFGSSNDPSTVRRAQELVNPSTHSALILRGCEPFHYSDLILRSVAPFGATRLEGWPQALSSPPSFETHPQSATADCRCSSG